MKIKSLLWIAFLLFSLIALTVDAKKAGKKKRKVKGNSSRQKRAKPEKSSPKKPDGTSAELYCNAC